MASNGFDLSCLDQDDARIVVEDHYVAGLMEFGMYRGEPAVQCVLLPGFFEWLENELFVQDWGSTSWEIAGEILLFKPLEQLSEYCDADELLSELDIDSPTDITPEFVAEQLIQRAQWCAESDAPGLHVFPLIIQENVWFLIGALQFWQGGVVCDWLGLTSEKESISVIVQQAGYYSTSIVPGEELINLWRAAALAFFRS